MASQAALDAGSSGSTAELSRPHGWRSIRRSAALGLIVIVLVGLGGYGYFVRERRALVRSATGTLEAIADLRVQQVRDWIVTIRFGVEAITENPFLGNRVASLLKSPPDPDRQRIATAFLRSLTRGHPIDYILLLDADGRMRAASPADAPADDPEFEESVLRARRTGQPAWTDLHRDGDRVLLECVIPVAAPPGTDGTSNVVGYLWLRSDPTHSLFPLIQKWPTPSKTGETLLVRREAESVSYLNELRHRRGPALSLTLPIEPSLPAARVVLGHEGVLEGRDYRNVPVLAVLRQVPGTTWGLVAKMDLDEIHAPVRERAGVTIVVAMALVLAVVLAVGAAWQRREARFYRREYEAEAERALLTEHLAYLSRYANDIILLVDDNLRVVEANERAVEAYGYDLEELRGLSATELLVPGEKGDQTEALLASDDDTGRVFTTHHRRRTGAPFPVEVSARLIRTQRVRFVQSIIRDISERSQLEAQLRQAQKMEAVGQLAGGIAHDFNNLLTIITGRSEMALDSLTEDTPVRHDVELILDTAERAAGLIRQLLAFSRRQSAAVRVVDLNAVLDGFAPMMRRVIGEDVAFATVAGENVGHVRADPAQLEQILMNLVVNARDAMPDGGQLTIETKNVELDLAYARTHVDVSPGRYVQLSVSDTGHGMTPETQARIFEPFFTTKEQRQGTGLGLATVHGIVKQMAGHITVYSEAGHGTTFKIYFPRVDEAAEPATPGAAAPSRNRGSETILLVEDEDEVRALAQETLEASGYHVIAAATPTEALAVAGGDAASIHLLLTDVIMPQMSGPELAERLSRERKHLKVLYMSGYTGNVILRQGMLDENAALLQKPFTTRTLRDSVRQALQQA